MSLQAQVDKHDCVVTKIILFQSIPVYFQILF